MPEQSQFSEKPKGINAHVDLGKPKKKTKKKTKKKHTFHVEPEELKVDDTENFPTSDE